MHVLSHHTAIPSSCVYYHIPDIYMHSSSHSSHYHHTPSMTHTCIHISTIILIPLTQMYTLYHYTPPTYTHKNTYNTHVHISHQQLPYSHKCTKVLKTHLVIFVAGVCPNCINPVWANYRLQYISICIGPICIC